MQNILKLQSNTPGDTNQMLVDMSVELALKETEINPNKIYTGNMDFTFGVDLSSYTHYIFLAGLEESVVIHDIETHEVVYSERAD